MVNLEKPGRSWRSYLAIVGLVILFLVLPMAALLYFQDEIRQAQAYGFAGVFVAGLLSGITIIPAPTLLLIFTFGRILNPLLVGLVAGFGAALGGVTVYLTGAGAITIWTKLQNKEHALEQRLGIVANRASRKHSHLWINGKAFYSRMVQWISGEKGAWALFVTSALVISPFYPAGLAAGSLRMGLVKFFVISWAGKTVSSLLIAIAGYYGLGFISNLLR